MTTILPPRELAVIRAVAKSAAVLFVWMSIERLYPDRPVSEYEFADMLCVDVRTVQRQLRCLSSAGLALRQASGHWVLTPNGRNTLFASSAQNVRLGAQVLQPLHVTQSIEALEVIEAGSDKFVAQNVPLEEEELKESVFNESSSSEKRTFCASTEEILKFTYLLFEGSVNINETTKSRDPMTALAWISKAYHDRKNMNLPQGLVYKRLMEDAQPPVYLRKNPFAGLPADYLEAIGYQDPSAHDDEAESVIEEVSESDENDDCVDLTPSVLVWRGVKAQLQSTMPRNTFDLYVSQTEGMVLEDGVLTVLAKCEQDADWLESRLESTANRMLVGICGREVRVRFVSTGGQ